MDQFSKVFDFHIDLGHFEAKVELGYLDPAATRGLEEQRGVADREAALNLKSCRTKPPALRPGRDSHESKV